MTLTKQSPEAVGSGNRAEIEAKSKAAIEGANNSAPAVSLQVEAAQFSKAKRKQKGSPGRFVIERDGHAWQLSTYPVKDLPQVIRGLTYPEAHRKSREFSDQGFEGLVIGGPRYV